MRSFQRAAALIAAGAVLVAVACSGDTKKQSNGDLVDRTAAGPLADTGGARRLDGDQSQVIRNAINSSNARNVILIIGDGMGASETTIARNYEVGAGGSFAGLDSLPLTGEYTHYALNKDGKPDYVTDSAASASAWATGTKTYNGALSVDINGAPKQTILELAEARGLMTGNLSTAEIQDATPAALFSHVTGRKCYGPVETTKHCPKNALQNGGQGSITEQLLTVRPDVTLGGGAASFAQVAAGGQYRGKPLEVQAKERGFRIVRTAAELTSVTAAGQNAPLLGLFADGNMPVRWSGAPAERQGYLQPAVRCSENSQRGPDMPTLADMTQKAIDLLKTSGKGFFLQVEGASIDKQDHLANPCAQIGETVDLDAAVQKALQFAKTDGNTLVIVTADHSHTSQIVENFTMEDLQMIADSKKLPLELVRDVVYPGLTRRLITKDGAEMTVSYGTSSNPDIENETHTGAQLPVSAFGPRAANVVGLTDQTDLFFTMSDALGLKPGDNPK
jgi:alkaline phosphatase